MQIFLTTAVHPWRMCREIRRFAEERGALQHVVHLVARGASPSVIFNAAAYAVGRLIKADCAVIMRYETDQTISVVTYWRSPGSLNDISIPFGGRWPLTEDPLAAELWRSPNAGRPAGGGWGGAKSGSAERTKPSVTRSAIG